LDNPRLRIASNGWIILEEYLIKSFVPKAFSGARLFEAL
jgi:hypothetical protein